MPCPVEKEFTKEQKEIIAKMRDAGREAGTYWRRKNLMIILDAMGIDIKEDELKTLEKETQ
jgi:hypothetical protein